MYIECDDGDDDGQVHDHKCKQEIFAEQWNDQRGRRDQFNEQKVEDEQGDENGDGQGDLLLAVRREKENEHGKNGDIHARNNEIHDVEQRFTLYGTGEC